MYLKVLFTVSKNLKFPFIDDIISKTIEQKLGKVSLKLKPLKIM